MSGINAVWTVRRFSPDPYESEGRLTSYGEPQTFYTWSKVCEALDTIFGRHGLATHEQPADPVVIKQGDDIVLVYMQLEVE
jgi:hypothetical protein